MKICIHNENIWCTKWSHIIFMNYRQLLMANSRFLFIYLFVLRFHLINNYHYHDISKFSPGYKFKRKCFYFILIPENTYFYLILEYFIVVNVWTTTTFYQIWFEKDWNARPPVFLLNYYLSTVLRVAVCRRISQSVDEREWKIPCSFHSHIINKYINKV